MTTEKNRRRSRERQEGARRARKASASLDLLSLLRYGTLALLVVYGGSLFLYKGSTANRLAFDSVTFLFTILPIILLLYYLAPPRARNGVLLICSLLFYAWGEPLYLAPLVLSILFNYFSGIDIARNQGRPRDQRSCLTVSVAVNLLVLGFFAYFPFLASWAGGAFSLRIPCPELVFPVGLSVYTLQALAYLTDVYRGRAEVQINPLDFGVEMAVFPRMIVGPVLRCADAQRQLRNRRADLETFGQGVVLFLAGLGKKVLLADAMGAVYAGTAGAESRSVVTAWIGVLAFAFHIYFALSGYSDMAVGLGKLFGFSFPQNFNYPYLSRSITEFWDSWYRSAVGWFRRYVYFPLCGKRSSRGRQAAALVLTWALLGAWCGAGWNFLAWGIYSGLLLAAEKYILQPVLEKLPGGLRILYTVLLTMIGWVLFFSPGLGAAARYLGNLVGVGAAGFIDREALYQITTNWLLWLLAVLGSTPMPHRVARLLCYDEKRPRILVCGILYMGLFVLSIAYIVTGGISPILYGLL